MSCYKINYKAGHKVASPIKNREEYLAVRGSAQQNETLRLARSGVADAKRRLVQMNYSCLPNEDGTLKGAKRVSNSVGMDVDFDKNAPDYEQKMREAPQKILSLKDELGLLMLERSVNKGYHIVFRRHADMSNEENLQWASSLLGIQYDRGAKDITRVFFTTGADAEDLIFLDDALFEQQSAEGATSNSEGRKPWNVKGGTDQSTEGATSNITDAGPTDLRTASGTNNNSPNGLPSQMTSFQDSQTNGQSTNHAEEALKGRNITAQGVNPVSTEEAQSKSAVGTTEFHTGDGNGNMSPLQGSGKGTDGKDRVDTLSSDMSSFQDSQTTGNNAKDSLTFKGIEYKRIIERLLLAMGVDGKPEEGERNTYLYSLVRELRYITDFNVDKVLAVLPDWGLPTSEVRATVASAIGSARSKDIPGTLSRIIENLLAEKKAMEESGAEVETNSALKLPDVLPRFFATLIKAYPQEYKEAVLMASMPILGALATRVRSTYLDGSTHSPSFISCIVAPQALGKSFARHLYDLLTEPILAQDMIGREAERVYNEKKKATKNSKQQPEDPKAVIRLIPATASNAMILKRADYARRLHLLTFAEEIDTLTKGNRAGAWSQKSDLYRMAFDNATWGQDYMSENSYSGMVQLFYNLLICGTPNAMSRFFNDVEDGLVSRVSFITLPDMLGCQMPKFGKYSRRDKEFIRSIAWRLYNLGQGGAEEALKERNITAQGENPVSTKGKSIKSAVGTTEFHTGEGYGNMSPLQGSGAPLQLPRGGETLDSAERSSEQAKDSQANDPQTEKVTKDSSPRGGREGAPSELWLDSASEKKLSLAFTAWLEDKRMIYLQDQDNPALDIFRRRASVIGYRAGMVCWALEGKLTKESVDFSRWVAEVVLHNLLELFGEKMNETMNRAEEATITYTSQRCCRNSNLLQRLPSKFGYKDVMSIRMGMGLTTRNVGYIISRWSKNGLVEKIDEHTWMKV